MFPSLLDKTTIPIWQTVLDGLFLKKEIWVAYSGGVDSHALLHWLIKTMNFPIQGVVHINHQLQNQSSEWAKHCEKICNELNVLVKIVTIKIPKNNNLEENARIARQKAWQKLLPANAVLLLAHHQDDQIETLLLRLLRGAGPSGLKAMTHNQQLGKLNLMRPWLNVSKKEVISYAKINKLIWVEDLSNSYEKFDRNYLRYKIIPLLLERWPNIHKAFSQTIKACHITLETEKFFLEPFIDKILNYEIFENYPEYIQLNILRYWLTNKHAIIPSQKQLSELFHSVIKARRDAQPELVISKSSIKRFGKKLFVIPTNLPDIKKNKKYIYIRHQDIKLSSTIKITSNRIEKLLEPWQQKITDQTIISICYRESGSIIKISPVSYAKNLKKYFQEHKIPPWQRDLIPLLYIDKLCIAAIYN